MKPVQRAVDIVRHFSLQKETSQIM